MKITNKPNGTTTILMTRQEAGLRCPIALMKRKAADKKIAQAERELKEMGFYNK